MHLWKSVNVDFGSSGFVRLVGNPTRVGREAAPPCIEGPTHVSPRLLVDRRSSFRRKWQNPQFIPCGSCFIEEDKAPVTGPIGGHLRFRARRLREALANQAWRNSSGVQDRPSGDHTGLSLRPSRVNRLATLRSTSISQRSVPSPLARVVAKRRPSGESRNGPMSRASPTAASRFPYGLPR